MALSTAIVFIFVLLPLIAVAIEIGYLLLTKTQLQTGADAATLSGGTELMSGLGDDPVAPATVVSNGTSVAVLYAGKNRNGDVASSYADGSRDVRFGWARFDPVATPPAWEMHWGEQLPVVGGYNLIGVMLRRDVSGSANNDRPLPLMFARALEMFGSANFSSANLKADAAAVIMPAKGIRILPGSPTTANVMPFAIRRVLWEKYLRAQDYVDAHNGVPPANQIQDVLDEVTGEPLFGHFTTSNGKKGSTTTFVQDFADVWTCSCTAKDKTSGSTAGSDMALEIDVFPRDDYTAGNLGSIDIGSPGNETSDLGRQIRYGVNATDLGYYANNQFVLPRDTGGETGLSAGIKDDLAAIIGQCRAIFLFDAVTNPGNTATFSLVGMAGVRIMHVQLTGSMEYKHLSIQRCDATLIGAIPDIDTQIEQDTTVFTPLILIE